MRKKDLDDGAASKIGKAYREYATSLAGRAAQDYAATEQRIDVGTGGHRAKALCFTAGSGLIHYTVKTRVCISYFCSLS